jgi:hypothetical protein
VRAVASDDIEENAEGHAVSAGQAESAANRVPLLRGERASPHLTPGKRWLGPVAAAIALRIARIARSMYCSHV